MNRGRVGEERRGKKQMDVPLQDPWLGQTTDDIVETTVPSVYCFKENTLLRSSQGKSKVNI
jgi:hypothetical protein